MNEWRAEVAQQRKAGRSWTEIARLLRDTFPELTETQIRDKAKDAFRVKTRQKVYGVFSDIHAPFTHPNFLKFLQDTFRRERVTDIICLGDLVDNHAISRFNSEPSAKGAYDELDRAIDIIERYTTAFPKVRMIKGNHDLIAYRQAATLGIGKRFIKDFRDIYGLPKGWKVNEDENDDGELLIDGVLYKHGLNCTGKDGALNTAIQERMSTVIGHSHAFGGCKYSANKRNIIFGMNVGCGIDINAYAFAYGKHAKNRPTLGCGIVYGNDRAQFIPMGAEYFRD